MEDAVLVTEQNKDKISLTFLFKMCLMNGVVGSRIKPESLLKAAMSEEA